MEGAFVLESLDSLWFFSDLFSSRTQPIMSFSSEGITNEEDPPKPTKPIVHNQQNESPKAESLSPICSKCGEPVAEIEWPVEGIILQAVDQFKKHAKKEERSSSRRRKRKSKRKILGELDLGFDDNGTYLRECGVWEMNYKANACGVGILGSQQHPVKMPPLSDGMAMKEHLKSWAYAVACTVR